MNIRFLHMRRAGGHAVIDWFQRSLYPDVWWYHNSLSINARQARTFWHRGGDEKTRLTAEPKHVLWSLEDPNRGRSDPAEAVPIAEVAAEHWVRWLPEPDHTVLILRDFYNCVSSRLEAEKKPGAKKRFWREGDEQVWIDQARWALDHPEQVVLFNRWLSDDAYRADVKDRYGMNYAPYTSKVQKFGGGSSFTGYTTPADHRALSNRFLSFRDELKALESTEIRSLNALLFGTNATPDLDFE